jgi:hypothetical protein
MTYPLKAVCSGVIAGIAILTGSVSDASIVFTDNVTTVTATWSESFTLISDLSGGTVDVLVYEDMFSAEPSNGNPDIQSFTSTITINGDVVAPELWSGWNYRPGSSYELLGSRQIAILWAPSIVANEGDVVTLSGSMEVTKTSFFSLPDNAPSIVWFGNESTKAASDTAVPEPATYASVAGLAAIGLAFCRRNRRKA